ncbi:CDP-diacylglycerol--serine O-phosphatidyltransferase [Sodalis sp. CWE]|uniref:CDP-diacylglycerol--serine O-phosphatidyltransferase n=1 Tax=Sodalis sp. CWE TaxID=2803816 RepID=UPI001C7CBC2A|nr:CDP-diacylglycerol--serine O-phosphatidyltransferase [Sodalis sp. CWE]MBX4180679.1 CDP-diacylglycerol--serine O-phosphatidyltransferase [Sodalis sp. CWE]
MFSNFKQKKHRQYVAQLPKIPQVAADVKTLYSPHDFYRELIRIISFAKKRIYLVALYLEQDQGGKRILEAVYKAKYHNVSLDATILIDWHRAQRNRIGEIGSNTNADWYCRMMQDHPDIDVPIYGIPVNTREALGVFHLKGCIIDDQVIYSGASLNNVYLHQLDKYRYDRYKIIRNLSLSDTLLTYIKQYLLTAPAVRRLDNVSRPKTFEIKHDTKMLRQLLRKADYRFQGKANSNELAITPLIGLGRQSPLNKTIHHLLCSTENNLILCTPYFNLPTLLKYDLISLLRIGKRIEIVIGDKTANDFYVPEESSFKMIDILPYLYEINLRHFLRPLQRYIDENKLIVRLWQDGTNSFHIKGIWIDNTWQLLTGNNLNPRAWRLDLENALLIHDPEEVLCLQRKKELDQICIHTKIIQHFSELENIDDYPIKIRKFIRRLRRMLIDRLINRILL